MSLNADLNIDPNKLHALDKTLVDFYLLGAEYNNNIELFVCKLIEKAFSGTNKIFVLCDNVTIQKTLDDLLWSFKPASFLPHSIATYTKASETVFVAPIILGVNLEIPNKNLDLLINLQIETKISIKANRILEIVANNTDALTQARSKYLLYKQAGFLVNNFDLRKN